MTIDIALAPGDGIGPEIMAVAQDAIAATGAPVRFHPVDMGLSVWERGVPAGITDDARRTVEELGVLFKGPMATPKGGGVKSINVTARKTWTTYANQRVFRTLPGVPARPGQEPLHLTLVRENIEDTYGGIEHMQTRDVAQCRRLITRQGCEQVHRQAFRVAQAQGASRVTCGHKANIMKYTDGLFLETFRAVAKEFPDIESEDLIVDDLAMKLVMCPERFEVVVLPNLQGDILSDLCAGLVGGLAYAPSANIGDHVAIFEAVHGTAPDIVGQDKANPTALLLSAVLMLRHVGLGRYATRLERGIEAALVQAHGPGGIAGELGRVQTSAMRDLVVRCVTEAPLGDEPDQPWSPPAPRDLPRMMVSPVQRLDLVGADLFIDDDAQPSVVATLLSELLPPSLKLTMISNRGTQVWPTGSTFTDCINHHRCRVQVTEGPVSQAELFQAVAAVATRLRICSLEQLIELDGAAGFSKAQGQ